MKKDKEKETNSIASSSPNKERVLVYVRIRPFSEQEKKMDPTSPIENIDLNRNALTGKKKYKNLQFKRIMIRRIIPTIKFSQKIQHKKIFLKLQEKKYVIQHQKDTMEQYLHMVKQELVKHIQWQVNFSMKN